MEMHRRDTENMIHHHDRKFPQSTWDNRLMRLKDYALLAVTLGGLGGIVATTTQWIQKPSQVAENAVILAQRLTKIEDRVTSNEKTLQQINSQGQTNGESLQEVIRRIDRVENLLDHVLMKRSAIRGKDLDTNG